MRGILLSIFLISTPALAQQDGEIKHWDHEKLNQVAEAKGFTFQSGESWVTKFLREGGHIRQVTGLRRPLNWRQNARFVDINVDDDLPERFDWREEVAGGLQPIRNQGRCGSCWAFSVTSVVESLMKIMNLNQEPNLAEQTLVSTCSSSGSCYGGYFSAFEYIKQRGLPDEGQDPYQARNTYCRRGLQAHAKTISWSYVGQNGSSPTTDQIKAAIKEYGPVAVDVNGSFSGYRSGVYNNCNRRGTNHMVTLEGWDDSDGGYWIMRNSWGTGWGEEGYMRIRYTDQWGYKCNGIGRVAAFAVIDEDFQP